MAIDYDSIYQEIITNLQTAGIDVSSLTKGDESVSYRSADDLIKLLDYMESKNASGSAAIRTIAKNARSTV